MKIIVDELPKAPIECIFAQQENMLGYHACSLAVRLAKNQGMKDISDDNYYYHFCKCQLITGFGCPYLRTVVGR